MDDKAAQICRAPGSSPGVRAAAGKPVLLGDLHPSSLPGLPVEGGDDTCTFDMKMEGFLLGSAVAVAAHDPVGEKAAAARDVGNGRNKRRESGRPSATAVITDVAAPTSESISSSTRKRVRRTVDDDDVVFLESDDEAVASSRGMGDKRTAAKVKVKPEH